MFFQKLEKKKRRKNQKQKQTNKQTNQPTNQLKRKDFTPLINNSTNVLMSNHIAKVKFTHTITDYVLFLQKGSICAVQ